MKYSLQQQRAPSVEYDVAWQWQRETAEKLRVGGPESLVLLQHPPVFTFGRRARYDHLLVEPEELRRRGATLIESDRGGDVTFHGPGQIVAYPILDLKRRGLAPGDYIRALEETMVRSLAGFGIEARRSSGRPGVWTQAGKIGAVGVRVQGGVTTHGFALNVETDLSWFDAIVPCGIAGAGVASIETILGRSPGVAAVEDVLLGHFAAIFDSDLNEVPWLGPSATRRPRNLETRELVLAHGD